MKFVTFNADGTETIREFPFGGAVTGNMYDELRLDADDARRISEMGDCSPVTLADYVYAVIAACARIGNMNKPTPPPTPPPTPHPIRVIREGVSVYKPKRKKIKNARLLFVMSFISQMFLAGVALVAITNRVGRWTDAAPDEVTWWCLALTIPVAIPIVCVLYAYQWGRDNERTWIRGDYTLIKKGPPCRGDYHEEAD